MLCAMLENKSNGLFHPAGQRVHSLRALDPQRGKTVLDFRRDRWIDLSHNEAVCFQRLQGLSEHLFTYATDPSRQLTKPVRSFKKQDEDERTPTRCDVIEYASRWTVRVVQISAALNSIGRRTFTHCHGE